MNVAACAILGLLAAILLRLRKADQWHHGWLVLAALDLPHPVRVAALVAGADDLLNHALEAAFGWVEKSPGALAYALLYRLVVRAWR